MRYVNGAAGSRELLEQCRLWLCQFVVTVRGVQPEQEAELEMLAATHSKECSSWYPQLCFKCH